MFKSIFLITIISLSLYAGSLDDVLSSLIDEIKDDIKLVFVSALGMFVLVFGFKKVLYLLSITDFALGFQLKQRDKRAKKLRQRNKISNGLLKTSQTKKENERRLKAYKLKQDRKIYQEQRKKERKATFKSMDSLAKQFMEHEKKQKYISKNESNKPRAKSGRVLKSTPKTNTPKKTSINTRLNTTRKTHNQAGKKTQRKEFMSKKYNEYVAKGAFR